MRKRQAWLCWAGASVALLAAGCIHLLFDWLSYSSTLNSAPFSLWILLNAVGFGVPAALCALIAWILWRKSEIRKDDTL